MTVELDIVERKNEENLKLSKQMEDTVKKLIMEQGEPIAPIKPAINDAEYELANWVPPTPPTDIQRFYTGKNIFITGGTGFLGKMVIEKLLRTCPDVENIYMMVRPKRGVDIHTRLDKVFDDQVFDQLREKTPKFRHKIVAIAGDCAVAGLGISISDRQTLISNVHIVFHGAATVRFDEKIQLSVAINVHGTQEILDLCSELKNLQVIMHVSTAYSNCHLRFIEEKFYDFPLQYEDLCRLMSKFDTAHLDKITPNILGKWPNTYAFTKALSEDLIRKRAKNLPIGLFRPAIVTSSACEPVIGWIDNVNGPTGVIAGAGTGILRTLHCHPNVVANIVPVDMTVNALICSAWDVSVNHKERKSVEDIPIYNYVSSVENPLSWGEFTQLVIKNGFDYPFSNAIYYLSFHMNRTAFMNRVYMLFLHILPALLIDFLARRIRGKSLQLRRTYEKIHKFSTVISYFCTNDWMFTNTNVQSLWKKIGRRDQDLFNFDMKSMNWVDYSHHYIKGMRIYLFKDGLHTLDAARKNWNRLYWYHQMVKGILAVILLLAFAWLFHIVV